MNNIIHLYDEDGEQIRLFVLEQTRFNNRNYILATDEEDEMLDAQCYVLKDISDDADEEANYVFVEDDMELEAVFEIFDELFSDADTKIVK